MFQRHAQRHFRSAARVLELGPDHLPSTFARVTNDPDITWDTADIGEAGRSSQLTYVMPDEYTVPVGPGEYDIVFSGQVIEHVRRPWTWMRELARVCRKDGLVITINPVSWPYHEAPIDCWRIYPEGMRALCEEAGLEVIVSTWGCLEAHGRSPQLPGMSHGWGDASSPRMQKVKTALKQVIGWPLTGAFDTITVARKA